MHPKVFWHAKVQPSNCNPSKVTPWESKKPGIGNLKKRSVVRQYWGVKNRVMPRNRMTNFIDIEILCVEIRCVRCRCSMCLCRVCAIFPCFISLSIHCFHRDKVCLLSPLAWHDIGLLYIINIVTSLHKRFAAYRFRLFNVHLIQQPLSSNDSLHNDRHWTRSFSTKSQCLVQLVTYRNIW